MHVLLASLLLATSANAYEPRAVGACAAISFASNPSVLVHTAEMSGFTATTQAELIEAIRDVHTEFNAVEGTSAQVTGVSPTSDAFTYANWYGGAAPIIHVGWTDDPNDSVGVATWDVDQTTCHIREAHIQFRNPSIYDWAFMTPEDYGEPAYAAGLSNSVGRYFRISYIHELLHTFGFGHSNDTYSMLNYGDRPWVRGPASAAIRPLPDDMLALRETYPAPGDQFELKITNSWFIENTTSTATYPAASQAPTCAPSAGNGWADVFEPLCGLMNGVAATNEVCPGDNVTVRFTTANYSTEGGDLEVRMFITPNDTPTSSTPRIASTTIRDISLAAAESRRWGRNFLMPTVPYDRDVHVVILVSGTTDSGVAISEWQPMLGGLHVLSAAECGP